MKSEDGASSFGSTMTSPWVGHMIWMELEYRLCGQASVWTSSDIHSNRTTDKSFELLELNDHLPKRRKQSKLSYRLDDVLGVHSMTPGTKVRCPSLGWLVISDEFLNPIVWHLNVSLGFQEFPWLWAFPPIISRFLSPRTDHLHRLTTTCSVTKGCLESLSLKKSKIVPALGTWI